MFVDSGEKRTANAAKKAMYRFCLLVKIEYGGAVGASLADSASMASCSSCALCSSLFRPTLHRDDVSFIQGDRASLLALSRIHMLSKPDTVFSHAACGFGEIAQSEAWLFPRCFMRDVLKETRGSRHTRWSRDGSSLDYP